MHERDDQKSPTGTGPGLTGASGDLIDNTGGDAGIGGTGHDDDARATGQHPDERTLPSQQDVMEQAGEAGHATRPPGSATGTTGGGGA